MGVKEFFKPTWKKAIFYVIFLVILLAWFGPCALSCSFKPNQTLSRIIILSLIIPIYLISNALSYSKIFTREYCLNLPGRIKSNYIKIIVAIIISIGISLASALIFPRSIFGLSLIACIIYAITILITLSLILKTVGLVKERKWGKTTIISIIIAIITIILIILNNSTMSPVGGYSYVFEKNILTGKCEFGSSHNFESWYYKKSCDISEEEEMELIRKDPRYSHTNDKGEMIAVIGNTELVLYEIEIETPTNSPPAENNSLCIFDKKYEFKEDYKKNRPCNCTGTWISYESCPGPTAEVNKYVPTVDHIACNKLTDIDEYNGVINGVINVGFKESPYLQALEIIEKYEGEIIRISRECAWVYGEIEHKTYHEDYHMIQVKVKEGKEEEFIENIQEEDSVKYAEQEGFGTYIY